MLKTTVPKFGIVFAAPRKETNDDHKIIFLVQKKKAWSKFSVAQQHLKDVQFRGTFPSLEKLGVQELQAFKFQISVRLCHLMDNETLKSSE